MIQHVFEAWDYLIMAATMVASVAIGLYFRFSGGKQKTNEVGNNLTASKFKGVGYKKKSSYLFFL